MLIMDRNKGGKPNKIQRKSTERTNMEEKKISQKSYYKEGKKPKSNKKLTASLYLLPQKDCLHIPTLGNLQNT